MALLTHISTSGGLISAAFIDNIRELGTRQRGTEPESFALPWGTPPKSPSVLEDDIAAAWELLKERWDMVRSDLEMMDVSQVRDRWLLPLFRLLDFEPVYQRSDITLDENGKLRYPLSHRGWERNGAPAIHTVIPSQDLDARTHRGRGIKAKSPHDILQAFLNASQADEWGILSNGILLRLLRDFHHTFTKGYVQFDLESIFETRNYGDFRALYRLCHASRFVPQGEDEDAILPLEQFYKDCLATGIKVGEDLREQVREAIETLGNGFLDGQLVGQLQEDRELCPRYWSEILHVIYRILFLLFAEQRGMVPTIGAPLEDLYRSQYSIAALRGRAEGDIPREDDFTDLWQGLKLTFRMVREGAPRLGVFAYDGMLFEDLDVLAEQEGHESLLSGRACRNGELLRAVRSLTLIEREGVLQRISYADLGVEELGSIYESLLDFVPHVSKHPETVNGREIPANRFFLDPRGAGRKTTGSYYTHHTLVNQLIKSALLPVMRDRLEQGGLPVVEEQDIGEATAGLLTDYSALTDEQRMAGEQALLAIKVCDPAAGSGHFLVKANDALGAELARIRTGDEYPTEDHVQAAKREVLTSCIYAVDLNPMAVELCKVSLWLNASARDEPLTFVDHHIKCGNSLIGATPELMQQGIPTDAFQVVTGDDRQTVNSFRQRNRKELDGQLPLAWEVTVIESMEDLERWRTLALLADEQPSVAREVYARYLDSDDYCRRKLQADFWTAAFFWPLPKGTDWAPTHGEFMRLCSEGAQALSPDVIAQIERLAQRYHFFHWHLEFRDIFAEDGRGGFDCVLGNPPWERIKLQEKEFFALRDPQIANAPNAAARRRLISRLPKMDPSLAAEYAAALRKSECTSEFLRNSGRFPLTGVGDVNTYAVFAGLARRLVNARGRVGMVVPSGIATDYTYREFFQDLTERQLLVSQYDFENRRKLFPDVDSRMKFSLLTIAGSGSPSPGADMAFFLNAVQDLSDWERRFTLSQQDLELINPNTRTCPIFRTRRDAELTRKIYQTCPVLHNEETGENPWGVRFFTMFHMANDSHLFRTREELEAEGYALVGNRFVRGDEVYLPLYEAKMFWHFDHRFGTYEGVTSRRDTHLPHPTLEQSADPHWIGQPWYWVAESECLSRLEPRRMWMLAFRDVTNVTNERTGVFALLPWTAVGHKAPVLLLANEDWHLAPLIIANLNSAPFDYIVRQKMGSTSLTFFIVRQLPVVPPSRYSRGVPEFIVPRALELTYAAWDIKTFADDIWREADESLREAIIRQWEANVAETGGHVGAEPPSWVELAPDGFPHPPFKWDEERRARLRAELDAIYAHLYGLTREELDYILGTFPIVRRKEEDKYGEYRTKRMVLEEYEKLEGRFD